ncbi:MAG: hypothetical protein AB7E51_18175 [Pseudodesulfovibrio sp.]|uniref:hypothetical protein n=1 Tax=Pseudodesulfovibrio sp. TaxID=2035812 RepID=UPI003D0B92C7
MQALLSLVILVALVAAILGLIKPGLVLFFLPPEKRTRLKAFGLYAAVFVLCAFLLPMVSKPDKADSYLAQLETEAQQAEKKPILQTPKTNMWYEGGSLHKSTVSQWKDAGPANRLATAADWVLVSPKIKTLAQNSSNIDVIKPFAEELVICVDKTVEGQSNVDQSKTAEVATMCMVLMGYLK